MRSSVYELFKIYSNKINSDDVFIKWVKRDVIYFIVLYE